MTTSPFRPSAATPLLRPLASLAFILGALCAPGLAAAQDAGSSAVVSMTLPSSAAPVQGWSIRHGLLGRPVYASPGGKQIGTVLDVVVTQAPSPYVLVIGAGGFIEVGGHAVAVPLDAVEEEGGLLILPGATSASLKAMPAFTYSKATIQRAQFIHATAAQLDKANAQLVLLQQRAAAQTGAAKAQLEQANAAFLADITTAEDKLSNLQKAETARWSRLRKDVEQAIARVVAGMAHPKVQSATAPGTR